MALTVSVIVCAHNEARALPAWLHSVLAQSRVPDEILVVNNASGDATKRLYSWKTLVRSQRTWPAIKAALTSDVAVALTLFQNGSWAA